jgi:hypothetical protein
MGQKVNPIAFRLAVSKDWQFEVGTPPQNDYSDKLHEDLKPSAAISRAASRTVPAWPVW